MLNNYLLSARFEPRRLDFQRPLLGSSLAAPLVARLEGGTFGILSNSASVGLLGAQPVKETAATASSAIAIVAVRIVLTRTSFENLVFMLSKCGCKFDHSRVVADCHQSNKNYYSALTSPPARVASISRIVGSKPVLPLLPRSDPYG